MTTLHVSNLWPDVPDAAVFRYILLSEGVPVAFGVFGDSVPQSQVGLTFTGRVTHSLKADQAFVDYGAARPALVHHKAPVHGGQRIAFECTADGPLMGEDAAHKGIKGRLLGAKREDAMPHASPHLPLPLRKVGNGLTVVAPSMVPVFFLREAGLEILNKNISLSLVAKQTEIFDFEAMWDMVVAPKINLVNGASMYVEKTQACFTVDVNISDLASSAKSLMQANIAALDQLEKHIYWRNMQGKIIVDLLRVAEDQRQTLIERVRALRQKLNLPLAILHRTGLLEIHRQRAGYYVPELVEYLNHVKTN